jgi:hypothetical protein
MGVEGPLPNGYRALSADELRVVNETKVLEDLIMTALDKLAMIEKYDLRALAIARTEFQTGFMWVVRAMTRPA